MDCVVPGIAKSRTRLSNFRFHSTVLIEVRNDTYVRAISMFFIMAEIGNKLHVCCFDLVKYVLSVSMCAYTHTHTHKWILCSYKKY